MRGHATTFTELFCFRAGNVIEPPIPIEDIVEKHLKLSVEFDDTHRLFGVPRSGLDRGQGPDILGAIFFDDQRIVIDESLDPEESPSMEGRFRFTLGHEGGGHWRLHRHLFAKDEAQGAMFDDLERRTQHKRRYVALGKERGHVILARLRLGPKADQ